MNYVIIINQSLVKTEKGIFEVTYNGENRPIKFTNLSDSTFITMKYDYMGRRGGKLHFNSQGTWTSTVKFFYKDYTLIEESTASNDVLKEFVWDPTAGQATKPLVFFNQTRSTILYYAHDANKNVTELVYNAVSSGMGAHYEYDVFGNIIVNQNYTMIGLQKLSDYNPFRFSSEYHDDELALIYYNYRHYNPQSGRWINRDPIEEIGGNNLYGMCKNNLINIIDKFGLAWWEWIPVVSTIGHLLQTPEGSDYTEYSEFKPTCEDCCLSKDIAIANCKKNIGLSAISNLAGYLSVSLPPDIAKVGVGIVSEVLTKWALKQGLKVGIGGTITGGILVVDGFIDAVVVSNNAFSIYEAGEKAKEVYCICSTSD